eukprot:UN04298
MLGVEWQKNCNQLTTFDSSRDSPIYVNANKQLGCASHKHGWKSLDYYIEYDKWQFVVAFGGDSKTKFYIGDRDNLPQYLGSVNGDIGGSETKRIGHLYQGPGKLGALIVYEGYITLDKVTDIYFQSLLDIGKPGGVGKRKAFKKILVLFIRMEAMADIVVQCLSG